MQINQKGGRKDKNLWIGICGKLTVWKVDLAEVDNSTNAAQLWEQEQQLQLGEMKKGIMKVSYTSQSTKTIPREGFRFVFVESTLSRVWG